MGLLFSKMKKKPDIVTLKAPIQFVGLSIRTNIKNIYRDAAALGKKYTNLKKRRPIPHLKEPWAFVAYSKDFDEKTKSWEYIMGDVVSDFNTIPVDFKGYEIPSGMYAVFTMQVKYKFMWGLEIGRMKKYIFSQWLPNSMYLSSGCEFELHNERSTGRIPSIDLYIGIKNK